MTDRYRPLTAAAVLLVAAFAAVVSYFHIYERGHARGQLPGQTDPAGCEPLAGRRPCGALAR